MSIIEQSILTSPSQERIKQFQTFHRIELPECFVHLMQRSNGAILQDEFIKCEEQDRVVERLLCILDCSSSNSETDQYEISVVIAQIEDRLTDDEDQLGTVIIPFAVLFGGDFICLDYRNNNKSPSIVLWDHEESEEFDPVTYHVMDSMEELLKHNFLD
ncbi:SMI1/KNR4 family protein [Celerinatantimonas sp. MCCC 1A17872]|uniref:SMI1/KNR4 family protein n=1 Tax=Celerinatantimonas sp. MCCC 1A17872 TaxID=3177514 RepID=UPI0038C2D7D9